MEMVKENETISRLALQKTMSANGAH
jgi:hypothetical protein